VETSLISSDILRVLRSLEWAPIKSNCGRGAEGILAIARRVCRSGGCCERWFGLTANDIQDGYRLTFGDRAQSNVVGNREGIYGRKRNP
jgi:hypothetical protein